MKLLTFMKDNNYKLAVASEDGSLVFALEDMGIHFNSMESFIEYATDRDYEIIKEKVKEMEGIPYDTIKKCAPIPKPKHDIICLGINYMEHAEESARYKKEAFGGERPYPIYFSKRVREAVGDGGDIQSHTDVVDSLDYEVELAVIIGKAARNVAREDAYKHVFGYTVLNDVSARNLQVRHKQWYFGKSLDGFTPIGPWIVTADEIATPPELKIKSTINNEIRQQANTNLLIFPIDYVINELSQGMTLDPGTIIAMGTPAGVGMGFEPPKFLSVGDTVVCEIEKIGKITNIVR